MKMSVVCENAVSVLPFSFCRPFPILDLSSVFQDNDLDITLLVCFDNIFCSSFSWKKKKKKMKRKGELFLLIQRQNLFSKKIILALRGVFIFAGF